MKHHLIAWRPERQSTSLGNSGPVRVATDDDADPNYRPRPVGFTATFETDPMLWEGDNG